MTKDQNQALVDSIATSVAVALSEMTPASRERSLALTKLDEFVFWAKAAIERNDDAATQG